LIEFDLKRFSWHLTISNKMVNFISEKK